MHGDELHLMVIQGYDDHMTLRGQGHGFVRGRDYSFARVPTESSWARVRVRIDSNGVGVRLVLTGVCFVRVWKQAD